MAVVAPSGVSARRCHRADVLVAADLLTDCEHSSGREQYIASLLLVMMYQLSCMMVMYGDHEAL